MSLALVGPKFPAGTLLVNLVGCFAMGVLAGGFALGGEAGDPALRLFLTTGVLAASRPSAFSLEAAVLCERGQPGLAAAYVLAPWRDPS